MDIFSKFQSRKYGSDLLTLGKGATFEYGSLCGDEAWKVKVDNKCNNSHERLTEIGCE
jgi:hypothetical protein